MREELLHFTVKLCGQSLVVRQDQRRALQIFDYIGYGKRFAGAGYPKQDLFSEPRCQPFVEALDCLRLIPGGLVVRHQLKTFALLHLHYYCRWPMPCLQLPYIVFYGERKATHEHISF